MLVGGPRKVRAEDRGAQDGCGVRRVKTQKSALHEVDPKGC